MRLIGVRLLVVTNAAGGLNQTFNVGDIMVIQDHFGLVRTGCSIRCMNIFFEYFLISPPSLGALLFVGRTTTAWVLDSRPWAMRTMRSCRPWSSMLQRSCSWGSGCERTAPIVSSQVSLLVISWHEAILYVFEYLSGPTYETKAECRFLRSIGGDAVGMSTIPEVIAAKHCGMKILGLSLITNKGRHSPPCTEILS